MKPEFTRAKRWANRLPGARSRADKRRCLRQMMAALYSALPPKTDGTHPLDASRMTLEVI